MIRGAIFDVDGTLMDSMWVWEQAFVRFVEEHGVTPDFGAGSEIFTLSLLEGAEYLKRELGLQQSAEEVCSEVAAIARELYFTKADLKPHVREFLEALKVASVPMVVLTSGEAGLIKEVFVKFGILDYFEHIYAASNEGISKREPTLWLRAAESIGAQPRDTWVFEDALYAITVTKENGFHTVAIADSHSEALQNNVREVAELYWTEFPTRLPSELLA
ncbi:MAG: HAD family phosphatase [Arcanobacterium sp.]|nr:HAD family phosphatase [Arcanobacterium sp.]MDY5589455.1 HAD family phosphatase [Arcanobacterium sp.]